MSSEPESSLANEERLNEIIAAYIRAIEVGETPNRQDLLAGFPEFAAELQDFFAGRDQVDRLVTPLRSAIQAAFFTPVPGEPPHDDATRNGHAFEAPGRSFGDYELLEETGRGGMGVVYRARQKSLNRLVALKMVRIQDLASATEAQRFRNEAETGGALAHPHIVPVYEVGERGGYLYFSMRLVEGSSLDKRLAEYAAQPRAAAQLVATVARAVHHAHQRGVLHRDLKPGNILLDAHGEPLVTDFGLAKRVESDSALTQSGALVGTPSYMAPEQTLGTKSGVTTATDVYGLGAVLYTLLAERPPFRGETAIDTLALVRRQEPTPPRRTNPRVDRDLECICLKCLQKEPELRYGSVELLAEDLEHWLAGKPVQARPIGRVSRVRRWCRRRPWVASLALISIMLVNLLLIGSIGSALWIARERNRTQEAARLLRRHLYAADVRLAQLEWERGYMAQARERLAHYEAQSGDEDLRSFAWHYLWRLCNQTSRTRYLPGHRGEVYFVAFAPDGKTLASAGKDGTARIWDRETGAEIRYIAASTDELDCVAFSPDGKTLATVGNDPVVKLWDIADSGKDPVELKEDGHTKEVVTVVFSPDGKRLATGGEDQVIRIWYLATRKVVRKLTPDTARINSLAFSPDGCSLASNSGLLHVWDMTTFEQRRFPGWGGGNAVTFSHNGKLLVASCGPTIGVWDFVSGRAYSPFVADPKLVESLDFAPDDRTLISTGGDGAIRLWDMENVGRMSGYFQGNKMGTWSTSLSCDGQTLAYASGDGMVRLLSLKPEGLTRLRSDNGKIAYLFLSPDGKQAAGAVGLKWRTIEVWEVTSGKILHQLDQNPWGAWNLSFSPDGRRLLIGTVDGIARVWDLSSGKSSGVPLDQDGILYRVDWSPDGHYALTNGKSGPHLWDAEQGLLMRSFEAETATFSPNGRSIVLTSPAEEHVALSILDLHTKEQRGLEDFPHAAISARAFTSDGRLFAAGGNNGSIVVWDSFNGKQLAALFGHVNMVRAMAFSPDGLTLASAGPDREIKLWDVRTWQELATLRGHEGEVFSLVFRPDGRTLISAGVSADSQAEVRFWSLDSDERGQ